MITLPRLPYPYDGLEPTMSATTLQLHHGKHHAKYVDTVNQLTANQPATSLEDVLRAAKGADQIALANNAGQAWNHSFFWNCLAKTKTSPHGPLLDAIVAAFGDVETLRTRFIASGSGHFGAGWVWLVAEGGALSLATTPNGATLANSAGVPLLVCDLWEHAYYLDHQNNRGAFLEGFWDRLANWEFADAQFRASQSEREPWTYDEGCRPQPIVSRHDFEQALAEVTAWLASPPASGSAADRLLSARLEQVNDYHDRQSVEATLQDKERFAHLDARLKAFERRWPKRPPPGTPDHWPATLGGSL